MKVFVLWKPPIWMGTYCGVHDVVLLTFPLFRETNLKRRQTPAITAEVRTREEVQVMARSRRTVCVVSAAVFRL